MASRDVFRIPTRLHKTMRIYRAYAQYEADDLFAAPGAERQATENKQGQEFIGIFLSDKRLLLVWCGILVICGVLLARLAYLQLFQGSALLARAERNRLVSVATSAARGFVYDMQGVLLVQNRAHFALRIDAQRIPATHNERQGLLTFVEGLTPISADVKEAFLQTDVPDGHAAFTFTDDLTYDAMLRAQSAYYLHPEIRVDVSEQRDYTGVAQASSLAHVLGYLGLPSPKEIEQYQLSASAQRTPIGKTGLEKSYDAQLRGTPGSLTYEVDAFGNMNRLISEKATKPGATLTLTIDVLLQRFAEEALVRELEKIGKRRAVLIALDPRNGAVRALVSLPAYNPNVFVSGLDAESYGALVQDPDQPLFPRAIAGTYPSGSTFKLITGFAGLAEGVITPQTTVLSRGGIAINQWFFPDWKAGGHGVTNLRKALAESVNTYFYMVGGGYETVKGVGPDALAGYARLFGLGVPLALDVPGEAAGFVPTPAWKETAKQEPWYIGDTYHFAIGQGDILVTPLQVAAYTSVFANGSQLYQPHLVTEVRDPETQEILQHRELKVLHEFSQDADLITEIRKGMRAAVTEGSARGLSFLPLESAGKTGTAQWHTTKDNHAWFTGFAPYTDAELVVTVLIEEGGEGSSVAVPVAREVFAWYAEHRMQTSP